MGKLSRRLRPHPREKLLTLVSTDDPVKGHYERWVGIILALTSDSSITHDNGRDGSMVMDVTSPTLIPRVMVGML